MNALIYESAKKDDYEAFGISTANYHYRFSFNQYKKLLVFQFDNPANFDIPFFSERFKRFNMNFELLFWKTSDLYFLPRFFLYYHDKIDKNKFTDEEIKTYIMLRSFVGTQPQNIKSRLNHENLNRIYINFIVVKIVENWIIHITLLCQIK